MMSYGNVETQTVFARAYHCREFDHDGRRGAERHRPEETVLYRVVSTYWPEFRERVEVLGSLPKFVVRDVDEYLRCGILEHGFIRVQCTDCGFERPVRNRPRNST